MSATLTQTQTRIAETCDGIRDMLIEKNRAYGNSALDPVRIFSKADPVEQLKVRLDDKLSRIMRGNAYPGDNDIRDSIGYMILMLIAEEIKELNDPDFDVEPAEELPEAHNPDGLTDEEVETSKGWRLLRKDEITVSHERVKGMEVWNSRKKWCGNHGNGYIGNACDMTYRTRLTREDLAEERGLST